MGSLSMFKVISSKNASGEEDLISDYDVLFLED